MTTTPPQPTATRKDLTAMTRRRPRTVTLTALGAVLVLALGGCVAGEGQSTTGSDGAAGQRTLNLDYAYYNPESLVIRDQGWLEEELADRGVSVNWVLSAGSNKANENLNAEAIDIGSTAGAAALLARANGSAIKTVGVFSQPEWSALVVPGDSTLTSVQELAGKKVAATKGTDPYFFLLQALREAGLSGTDVEVVNLQHADGRTALERGDVDAWAGLDPIMASAEIDDGARLLYRNVGFNTYGVLNAREAFLEQSPDLAEAVLAAYDRAEDWIAQNPDEAATVLAEEAGLSQDVARRQLLERTVIDTPLAPGQEQRAVLEAILPTLVDEAQVRSAQEARQALDTLFEPRYAEEAATS